MLYEIHTALLAWYHEHQRLLPWRETRDPYLIWVSEVILQQTRVVQGLDYYYRFVERFPSVDRLAEADIDDVLSLWQGLGYYSRARNMHKAARKVVSELGGVFPSDYATLLSLPGVGDYTAAAVSSFAVNAPHAAVDGNLLRVISRLTASEIPIDTPQGKRFVKHYVEELIALGRSAEVNQSLMELGALCCMPREAKCNECPLANNCAVAGTGRELSLPQKSRKTAVKSRYMLYLLVESSEGKLWIKRREGKDIWHSLYEFPLYESSEPIDPKRVGEVVERVWGCYTVGSLTGEFRSYVHRLTHRVLYITVLKAKIKEGKSPFKGFIEVRKEEIANYGMPIILTKAMEELL